MTGIQARAKYIALALALCFFQFQIVFAATDIPKDDQARLAKLFEEDRKRDENLYRKLGRSVDYLTLGLFKLELTLKQTNLQEASDYLVSFDKQSKRVKIKVFVVSREFSVQECRKQASFSSLLFGLGITKRAGSFESRFFSFGKYFSSHADKYEEVVKIGEDMASITDVEIWNLKRDDGELRVVDKCFENLSIIIYRA
jgi:hypothetical protein